MLLMNKYNIDHCKIFLDGTEVTGFAHQEILFPTLYPAKRLWYKAIEGKPFSVYATCDDGHVFEINFTEAEYDKWIKPMEPTKDPKIEENAILEIMTLAIYGAATKAMQDGSDVYESSRKVFELFKDAKLVK